MHENEAATREAENVAMKFDRDVQLARNDFRLVLQKKLWFLVWFRFYKINCSFVFSGLVFALCVA